MDRTRRAGGALLLAVVVAGCGATPPPGTSTPTTQPTATSTVVSTAVPTATPSPTPDDATAAGAALDAFAELTKRDDNAFHLGQVATVEVDGSKLADVTSKLDVNGSDFAGTIDALGQSADVVYVDGTGYSRAGQGSWSKVSLDGSAVDDVVSPWRYIGSVEDLEFDAVDVAGYRFVNSGPIPYQTGAMKAQGYSGVIDKLALVLAEDGTPVSITMDASAHPTTGQLAGRAIHMLTTVRFERFGEPVTIEKPV